MVTHVTVTMPMRRAGLFYGFGDSDPVVGVSVAGQAIGASAATVSGYLECPLLTDLNTYTFDQDFPTGLSGWNATGSNSFALAVGGGTCPYWCGVTTSNIVADITVEYVPNPKVLQITNITDPIIPTNSGLVNDCVLYRSMMTLLATDSGKAQGGVNITVTSDRNDTVPNSDAITQPKTTSSAGTATAVVDTRRRGVATFTAKADSYSSASRAKGFIDADFEHTFKLTAYGLALESDYSGAQTTDPCGVSGTFFSSFLKAVTLEGTGEAADGTILHYTGRKKGSSCYEVVSCSVTASGECAQAGTTIAVDPDVMPLGSTVNIANLGLRDAQDTGGKIKGEHIDVFVGAGKAAINGFPLDGTSQIVRLIGGPATCN